MTELEAYMRDEIAREGPISFARFMELALYHPTLGYYAGAGVGREPLGWSGDYVTSGDVHPLWGRTLARLLHQTWQALGCPAPFDVLELGAGRGLLAKAVWRYAREEASDWLAALRYTLADRTPADTWLRAAREERLARTLAALEVPAARTRWVTDAGAHFGARTLVGCIVSNELVDALPVHVVEVRDGALAEILVGSDASTGRLVEVRGVPPSPPLAAYLDSFAVPWRTFPDGWRAEIALTAEPWLRHIGIMLRRGLMVTIDYGATARRLYTRDHYRGTLMVYTQHQVGAHPLAHPGAQDLTAHVNFSALVRAGHAAGLRTVGYTTQGALLTRLGMREDAAALAARLYPLADSERYSGRGQLDRLRRATLRAAVATLLDPAGLGGFRVLAQHRGLPGVGRRLVGTA